MDIAIRPAGADDIPRMCDLLAELFSIESDFAPDREKQARGLGMLVTDLSGASRIFVAVHKGAVIGMATVQTLVSTAEGGRVGLVEDVIVERQFRSQGIGMLLLERIIDWGRRKRLMRLQLLADRENRPALDFYSSHSWISTRLICMRKLL